MKCFLYICCFIYLNSVSQGFGFLLKRAEPKLISSDETINASFTETYVKKVQHASSLTFVYEDHSIQSQAVRVHVTVEGSSEEYPVLFVVKDQRNVLSWQVPLVIENAYQYLNVSRTLCPENSGVNTTKVKPYKEVDIDVSTMSPVALNLRLMAEIIDINIGMDQIAHVSVSPSEPKYLHYSFPPGHDSVIINMQSKDELCMILSIQNVKCPVFDLTHNVEFIGMYQTVDQQGAITALRSWFDTPEFFIVLVVKPNDFDCSGSQIIEPYPARNRRIKTLEIQVTSSITDAQFQLATITAVCWFIAFYLIAVVISCIYHFMYKPDFSDPLLDCSQSRETEPLLGPPDSSPVSRSVAGGYGSTTDHMTQEQESSPRATESHVQGAYSEDDGYAVDEDTLTVEQSDVDMLHGANHDKDIVRTKPLLFVSDLARKPNKYMHKKYRLYPWNLIVIAIFYGLPVIQLVITYQKVLNSTGNQDLCYYNFLCARRLGVLSAFNNVYSNIGYVMLGLLFLVLVYRRNKYHQKQIELNPRFDKYHGIPQHFGLFYGVGIALIMEGVLSASYHVCPSYTNFQFDTSFMYMIAWLCMLKIYQNRHPDINANAHTAYFVISLVIFLAVLGVLSNSVIYMYLFAFVHVITCLKLSFNVYYMGRWKTDLRVFKRIYLTILRDRIYCFKPLYPDRMILLIIGNLANWSFAIYGIVEQPRDFASYLLAIFIFNLLMYFAFYIIMKLRSGESILLQPIIYTIIASVVWVGALWLFLEFDTSFGLTPAQSRRLNKPCMLWNFFDEHDLWHFMSSMALFFGFMVLLTLDDDLVRTPRDKIPVF